LSRRGIEPADPPAAAPARLDRITPTCFAAVRPVLFVVGASSSHPSSEVQQLAEKSYECPVASTSWGGRGIISEPTTRRVRGSCRMPSVGDCRTRSRKIRSAGCDLALILLQMTTGAWELIKPANFIQIDIDPIKIGKIFFKTDDWHSRRRQDVLAAFN